MTADNKQTYDYICFTDLVHEHDFSKKNEIEKKIKRRLKYHKLGDYNQARVDYIRQFKNELCSEISLEKKSKYYHKSESKFAVFDDFNIDLIINDFNKKYEKIEIAELTRLISVAIYLFYLK